MPKIAMARCVDVLVPVKTRPGTPNECRAALKNLNTDQKRSAREILKQFHMEFHMEFHWKSPKSESYLTGAGSKRLPEKAQINFKMSYISMGRSYKMIDDALGCK